MDGILIFIRRGTQFSKICFSVNKKLRTNVSCPKLPKIEGRSLQGKKNHLFGYFLNSKGQEKENFRDEVVGEGNMN